MIHKLIILKPLIQQDIWMIFCLSTILCFEGMVTQINNELQLNKSYSIDTEAAFLDLHLLISNGFDSSKIYDKGDDFDFDIGNFSFFWMATILVPFVMVLTFLNLFGLLEYLVM